MAKFAVGQRVTATARIVDEDGATIAWPGQPGTVVAIEVLFDSADPIEAVSVGLCELEAVEQ